MFPISSSNTAAVESTPVAPPAAPPATPQASAVAAADAANAANAATQLEPPAAPASVVDLSPVAQFSSNVSQARQQLNQLQAAVANGAAPLDTAEQASRLSDVAQNLVTAFNLLPAVDFNQGQPQGASLRNNLAQTLTQQGATAGVTQGTSSAAQDLARIGVTLQAPLLSDATGGLSLDREVLRAAFHASPAGTTATLQQTIATFGNVAAQFAQQASAAATPAPPPPASQQQPQTAADRLANARLDVARAALEQQTQNPPPPTGADRLAAQRAAQDQLAITPAPAATNPPQPQQPQQPAGPADPLRANPALAGALAAYNINDTAHANDNGRAAQLKATAVRPVQRVGAVAAVDTGAPQKST